MRKPPSLGRADRREPGLVHLRHAAGAGRPRPGRASTAARSRNGSRCASPATTARSTSTLPAAGSDSGVRASGAGSRLKNFPELIVPFKRPVYEQIVPGVRAHLVAGLTESALAPRLQPGADLERCGVMGGRRVGGSIPTFFPERRETSSPTKLALAPDCCLGLEGPGRHARRLTRWALPWRRFDLMVALDSVSTARCPSRATRSLHPRHRASARRPRPGAGRRGDGAARSHGSAAPSSRRDDPDRRSMAPRWCRGAPRLCHRRRARAPRKARRLRP